MDILSFKVDGIEEIGDRLTRFDAEVVSPALTRICQMLVSEFKKYPEEKSVTRKEAFGGNGFFSDKQRRWFFANLKEGAFEQPYTRTRRFERSWRVNDVSNTEKNITNAAPYAGYVMGTDEGKTGQSRLQALIGWKKISAVMEEKFDEMRKIFEDFARSWR